MSKLIGIEEEDFSIAVESRVTSNVLTNPKYEYIPKTPSETSPS